MLAVCLTIYLHFGPNLSKLTINVISPPLEYDHIMHSGLLLQNFDKHVLFLFQSVKPLLVVLTLYGVLKIISNPNRLNLFIYLAESIYTKCKIN